MLLALITNLVLLILTPVRLLRRLFASPRGGYVLLEVDGRVVDNRPPRPRLLARLTNPEQPLLTVVFIRELGRLLANDPRAAGLVIRIRSLSAGPSVLASFREVLLKLRQAGKDVVVHAPMGADSDVMFLASAANRIVIGPETQVAPIGYAVETQYVKRTLERIGVEPEVFARGTYKSAAEPLVRDDMSPAQREQLEELLGARHALLVSALAERCAGDQAKATEWIDAGPYRAAKAVEVGLVDHVAYDDELDALLGAPEGQRARVVWAHRYLRARRPLKWRPLWPRPVVGLIEVHGPIVSRVRFSMGAVASEQAIVRALRVARLDPRIASVVLHIDSPGGSAVASDRIHHEVERLAAMKPVVAYLSNVAASGGYYIAAAARVIVAQPQTVTGSIGVVATHFVVHGLLEKLGISTDVVKRGARADLFSSARPLDDAERSVLEHEVDAFYKTFVGVVARGRNRSVEDVEKLAQGRIYSGTEAHARGLVDELGGLERALDRAAELAGFRHLDPVLVRPPRVSIHPPPPIPKAAETFLGALGLGGILGERLVLGLNLERTELVLAYESLGSDGRTWLDVT